MQPPTIILGPLPHADGSVDYQYDGYKIVVAVNGPVEAQRRDELPEEAFLEVNIRAASGAGSPRDRQLESLLKNTLRSIVDVRANPRSLIQLTLQVLRTPDSDQSVTAPLQSQSILPLLPNLVNSAILTLLNANIPMLETCTSVLVVQDVMGQLSLANGGNERDAQGLFVAAFDGKSQCLLLQSEGSFTLQNLDKAYAIALQACTSDGGLRDWLRHTFDQNIQARIQWRTQAPAV